MTYFGILCIMIQIIAFYHERMKSWCIVTPLVSWNKCRDATRTAKSTHKLHNSDLFFPGAQWANTSGQVSKWNLTSCGLSPIHSCGNATGAALKKGSPSENLSSSANHWLLTQKLDDVWILLTSSSPTQTWRKGWNLEITLRWLHICTHWGQKQTSKRTG